ncbi:MAG: S41 family peptidase [Clostridium sp.]|nr:S41 family peptidase [Clostridium sp.]
MKKISLLLAATVVSILSVFNAAANDFDPSTKLRYAEKIIENYYVDSVPAEEMVDKAIVAMLKTLDPHSTYSDPSETKALTEPLQGNFSGIGIQFRMQNDTLYVIETVAGGPSERVGIVAGDRILTANDTLISGVKKANADVIKLLRGPKGTVVNIGVLRKGVDRPINFRIVRDDIPLYSVDASYMAAPGIGYIKVSRFAESTPEEVFDAVKKLRGQGMKDLIIDLQDNGGGYLQSAVALSEMLLSKGDPIVSTRGDRAREQNFGAVRDGSLRDGRVVVLVNQYSASASEILSGAVQDNDRGVIVGRRTFGKGLVQRPFPMPDGSMIRLTIARYYTPSGRCIQKPYTPGDEEDYNRDLLNRYKSGEWSSADSIHFADSLRYTTLRNRRTVYGGGGIMPDRFVPIDTTGMTTYSRDMIAKGVMNTFCIGYIDKNRKELKKQYPDIERFVERFEVSPAMVDELVATGEKEGVAFNEEQFAESRGYLLTIVKAILASDLYGHENYYRVINPLNPVYNEGLRILTDPDAYRTLLR